MWEACFTFCSNQFVIFLWVTTQWLFSTVSMANPGCGCSCWTLSRSPFALFLCSMAKRIWLGDLRFALCVRVSFCFEMITSYQLSPQQICFTHKLEPVTSRLCGLVVAFLLCVFVCFWFFVFRFLFSVLFSGTWRSLWTMYRSSSSLLLRPLQHRPLRKFNN